MTKRMSHDQMRLKSFIDSQSAIRQNLYSGHTAGLVADCLQGNLIIVPKNVAFEFSKYCQRNPKACPVIAISDVGNSKIPYLNADIDVCTDLPGYYIYRYGVFEEEIQDIISYWNDDMVAFVLGCSFGFEHALLQNNIRLKHIEQDKIVPMFVTNIETNPSGIFFGNMVVSMRMMSPKDVIDAIVISSKFPSSHGAPIHIGNPNEIGISDISNPDWGDNIKFDNTDIPVFWPCGVTPQLAIQNAKLPICISHAPGKMLITNKKTS